MHVHVYGKMFKHNHSNKRTVGTWSILTINCLTEQALQSPDYQCHNGKSD